MYSYPRVFLANVSNSLMFSPGTWKTKAQSLLPTRESQELTFSLLHSQCRTRLRNHFRSILCPGNVSCLCTLHRTLLKAQISFHLLRKKALLPAFPTFLGRSYFTHFTEFLEQGTRTFKTRPFLILHSYKTNQTVCSVSTFSRCYRSSSLHKIIIIGLVLGLFGDKGKREAKQGGGHTARVMGERERIIPNPSVSALSNQLLKDKLPSSSNSYN